MNLLERFDEHVRRRGTDADGLVVGEGWSAVLVVPPDIDRTLARLRELPGTVEWKLYGHDPEWLPGRLRAAGMEPEAEETVLVAEPDALPAPAADVELRSDPDAFVELAARIFGRRRELPPTTVPVVAIVDGTSVSGGRVDLEPGSEFAGLYGGVTVEEYRGRGLYRATVLRRAEIARERGYRFLYVDALPTSRPILERLGFVALTTTTPWFFSRDPAASSSD